MTCDLLFGDGAILCSTQDGWVELQELALCKFLSFHPPSQSANQPNRPTKQTAKEAACHSASWSASANATRQIFSPSCNEVEEAVSKDDLNIVPFMIKRRRGGAASKGAIS